MLDKLAEILVPSEKQRLQYTLVGFLCGVLVLTPSEYTSWIVINKVIPTLDMDRALCTLVLLVLLFAYSTYLLRQEKDAEIYKLTDRIETCKNLALQLKTENDNLKVQLKLKKLKDSTKENLDKMAEFPKIKLELPTQKIRA